MMKILFLQDNAINESLALMELSTCLKEHGHSTELLIDQEEKDIFKAIGESNPHVVVVPFQVGSENWFFPFYNKVKAVLSPNTLLITGGAYPTFHPQLIEHPDVDTLLKGEAEAAMVELLRNLENGTDYLGVQNFSFKRNHKIIDNPVRPQSDKFYAGDRDLYYRRYPFMGKLSWKKFASGRGCVHSCSFCSIQAIKRTYVGQKTSVRQKEPRALVDEIISVKSLYGLKTVHFGDDLFTVNRPWLREFSELYRTEVGLPLSLNTTAELLNQEIVDLLKRAGTHMIAIGVDTGSEDLRLRVLNKKQTNDMLRKAAKLIKSAGISLTTFNMIGFPGERIEDALSTLKLSEEMGADFMRMRFATPIPGTDMMKHAIERGLYEESEGVSNSFIMNLMGQKKLAIKTMEQKEDYIRLYYWVKLYPWVKYRKIQSLWRWLPIIFPVQLLELLGALNEKRINRIGWREGIEYYWHVGSPQQRTVNSVSLI